MALAQVLGGLDGKLAPVERAKPDDILPKRSIKEINEVKYECTQTQRILVQPPEIS